LLEFKNLINHGKLISIIRKIYWWSQTRWD